MSRSHRRPVGLRTTHGPDAAGLPGGGSRGGRLLGIEILSVMRPLRPFLERLADRARDPVGDRRDREFRRLWALLACRARRGANGRNGNRRC
jgi:hypothetical protein